MPQDIDNGRRLTPEESKKLEDRQRSFLLVQEEIKDIMDRVAPAIEEEQKEDVVR